MKTIITYLFLCLVFISKTSFAQLPKPDHIVVLILENHPINQILNNTGAPYINSLISDNHTAFFSSSYALGHPSQPNYLMLYSGSNQGVINDATSLYAPFTATNLGASLIQNGYSFATYSEDLPYEGFLGDTNFYYCRKHNPCANWQGTQTNGVPASCNKMFSGFPTNFDSLPTVSFVVPNLLNDMHNNYWLPSCIVDGDNWVNNNLNSYIQWCKTNNSLFVLTFDEDDYSNTNHITTFFTGQMVLPIIISDSINHFSLLRTFEEMYQLPNTQNTLANNPILNCWTTPTQNSQIITNDFFEVQNSLASNEVKIKYQISAETIINIDILDAEGRVVYSKKESLDENVNQLLIKNINVADGLYFINLTSNKFSFSSKLLFQK